MEQPNRLKYFINGTFFQGANYYPFTGIIGELPKLEDDVQVADSNGNILLENGGMVGALTDLFGDSELLDIVLDTEAQKFSFKKVYLHRSDEIFYEFRKITSADDFPGLSWNSDIWIGTYRGQGIAGNARVVLRPVESIFTENHG